MKTSESIERTEEAKKLGRKGTSTSPKFSSKRTAHLAAFAWKPGQSGNPSGRPKNDVAREIAKAVFENNKEALYRAFAAAALKGNAYAFQQLADRAYGKLKETHVHEGSDLREVATESLEERISQLERELGYAADAVVTDRYANEIDQAGRVGADQARTGAAQGAKKD